MTFLKKLGTILAQGIAIATGVWPLVQGLFGSSTKAANVGTTVINDLTAVGQVVVQVEALMQTPGSGATKLAAAAPLVANIVKTSELVSGHTIANETLFLQGCTDITNAVAEILNSLSANGLKTNGQPQPTPPATPTSVPSIPVPPIAPAQPQI